MRCFQKSGFTQEVMNLMGDDLLLLTRGFFLTANGICNAGTKKVPRTQKFLKPGDIFIAVKWPYIADISNISSFCGVISSFSNDRNALKVSSEVITSIFLSIEALLMLNPSLFESVSLVGVFTKVYLLVLDQVHQVRAVFVYPVYGSCVYS